MVGEWSNCRNVESLQKLIDARAVVVAASDALGGLVSFGWGDWFPDSAAVGVADFFSEHAGHALAPMDEYGRFAQQCYKAVSCPHCGVSTPCRRDAAHDGPCSAHKTAPTSSDPC